MRGRVTSSENLLPRILFFGENGQAVKGAVIDPNSTEGQDFIDQEIIAGDPNLVEYALNAGNGDDFDLKDRKIKEAVAEGKTPINIGTEEV